jgi:hypothetical protein
MARPGLKPGTPRSSDGGGVVFKTSCPTPASAPDPSVSAKAEFTPVRDEDQASAGARSAPTALLHPWKAAVTLPLSRSMQLSGAHEGGRSTGALLLPRGKRSYPLSLVGRALGTSSSRLKRSAGRVSEVL